MSGRCAAAGFVELLDQEYFPSVFLVLTLEYFNASFS